MLVRKDSAADMPGEQRLAIPDHHPVIVGMELAAVTAGIEVQHRQFALIVRAAIRAFRILGEVILNRVGVRGGFGRELQRGTVGLAFCGQGWRTEDGGPGSAGYSQQLQRLPTVELDRIVHG